MRASASTPTTTPADEVSRTDCSVAVPASIGLENRIFNEPGHRVFLFRALMGMDAYLKQLGTVTLPAEGSESPRFAVSAPCIARFDSASEMVDQEVFSVAPAPLAGAPGQLSDRVTSLFAVTAGSLVANLLGIPQSTTQASVMAISGAAVALSVLLMLGGLAGADFVFALRRWFAGRRLGLDRKSVV